ncbi:hypothetical protein Tco_1077039 [Tanacetum coccineum]
MHDPRVPHLAALQLILCYVRGTVDYGLQLYSSSLISLVAIFRYADCGMRSEFCSDLTSSLSDWGLLTVVDIGLGSFSESQLEMLEDICTEDSIQIVYLPSELGYRCGVVGQSRIHDNDLSAFAMSSLYLLILFDG